ncbi:UDP-N-acetylmuramate dehydrogenase [Caulobacter sp. DWR1-3-2b1]|uniref:UDP-N-acetylmuramate dehydrogenase n=1 Tax=Caulobacter sp. DWR1-3-2b1 TaxID=2804670 RepID=UPI003CF14F64
MSWKANLPAVRGKLLFDEPLGPFTWFRVGGPAEVLFLPVDADDLRDFLKALPLEVPVQALGVGSNVIIRDGGVEGVVIRCAGRAFGEVTVDAEENLIIAGPAALDASVARAAARAGLTGLEFFVGIPGTVGGALTMNAGCYGRETKDILVSAWGYDRSGEIKVWNNEDFGFTYRHTVVPANSMFWVQAMFRGTPDDPADVRDRMAQITSRRETTQPIREKTGGSTFKNPPGHSSWKLVDEAGWRGKPFGGAMFSPLHSNFLINTGEATAADLEGLGDAVRADVLAQTGIQLDWEIKRIGRPG